jgi:hypothetical protein
MAIVKSIETGVGEWTTDFVLRTGVPDTNILLGGWIRPTMPTGAYPRVRGNNVCCQVLGTNWQMLYLDDNMILEDTGYLSWYNANSMFWAAPIGADPDTWTPWYTGNVVSGDYNMYVDTGSEAFTAAEAASWKFFIIQLVRGASSFVSRIWIKIGSRALAKISDETITYADLRTGLINWGGWTSEQAAAWTPGASNRITIGDGTDGTYPAYVTHWFLNDASSEPSLSTLEAIAAEPATSHGTYADWVLTWESGAPVLTDRSGNSRTISNLGTLYEGVDFDDRSIAFPPLFSRREKTLLRR